MEVIWFLAISILLSIIPLFFKKRVLLDISIYEAFIPNNRNLIKSALYKYKMPVIGIILMALIAAIYSAMIGEAPLWLMDRSNYTYSYANRYTNINTLESLINHYTEIGFTSLNLLLLLFTDDVRALYFVITFFFMLVNIHLITKLSVEYIFSIILIFVSGFFLGHLSGLRQACAIIFGNLAFFYYLKNKNTLYFCLVAIACLFHLTALVFIPIFIFYKLSENKTARIYVRLAVLFLPLIFLPILVFLFDNVSIIGKYFSNYDILSEKFRNGTISSVLHGFPVYFLTSVALIKRKALIKINQQYDVYISALIAYSAFHFLNYYFYWFLRFGAYFTVPMICFAPVVFRTIEDRVIRISCLSLYSFSLAVLTIRTVILLNYQQLVGII